MQQSINLGSVVDVVKFRDGVILNQPFEVIIKGVEDLQAACIFEQLAEEALEWVVDGVEPIDYEYFVEGGELDEADEGLGGRGVVLDVNADYSFVFKDQLHLEEI